MSPFRRFDLRTTDPRAAEAFYEAVLGRSALSRLTVSALPERARARGAPPHWLGHLAVGDVEEPLRRLVAVGAEQLGPRGLDADDRAVIVVRDPFGAVLALSASSASEASAADGVVAWHQHHTTDRDRAFETYVDLFGWKERAPWALGGEIGPHRTFAWGETGPAVGSVANSARLPHVHTQWLFYFAVDDVDAAADVVRERGGLVVQVAEFPTGARVAVCDDPQGGAFALHGRLGA